MANAHRFYVPVGVVPLAAPPVTPQTGETYFDTTLGQLQSWDGSTWVGASSDVDLDAQFLNVPGDAMTGELSLPDQVAVPPSAPVVVAAKGYVDQLVTISDAPPSAPPARDGLIWSVTGPGIDLDTQKFLDATGLDESFAPALDGLVVGLKSTGLWTKMNAVYPFIGGTADFHKWNLIDPRDADDAFRLTFTGPYPDHSQALGYKPNPSPDYSLGYADTHLVPAGTLDPNSVHLSLYSLTTLSNAPRCDMGIYNVSSGGERFHLITHYTAGEFYYTLGHLGTQNVPAGDGSGLYLSSRTATDAETAYRNGSALGSNGNPSAVMPPLSIHIGILNGYAREASDLAFGFASIGSGLSAQNAADLSTVVEVYQAALGRGTNQT